MKKTFLMPKIEIILLDKNHIIYTSGTAEEIIKCGNESPDEEDCVEELS